MKPITSEWIAKAEGDFFTAQREMNAANAPNYDASCFHSHQCVEKYMKARLVEGNVSFPKVHDLSVLLTLVLPLEPQWEYLRPELNALTDIGVEVRYPGKTAEADDAEYAF